jgi:cation diffusion facilitator CzcD-associated flavoprotein CzcO
VSDSVSSTGGVADYRQQLAEKYREEREKRVRSEGMGQFLSVDGRLAQFADDPYAGERAPRAALTEQVDVVVVGAGIGGLLTSVELRRAGIDNFRVIEKGGDVGGTWYWNRYPGLRCDCESLIYLPLLEELGYLPSERYTRGSEISQHLRAIADKFAVYENALLQTQVTDIQWSHSDARWHIFTDRGDALYAKYVVLGSGPLHRPKPPGIPGILDFKGRQWHSSRWDYEFTGGDTTGGLDKLGDKRVAVVGTGATAVQIVPNVAPYAEHLYVVQRTPVAVDTRDNAPVDRDWLSTQKPGWQRRRMENFDAFCPACRRTRT